MNIDTSKPVLPAGALIAGAAVLADTLGRDLIDSLNLAPRRPAPDPTITLAVLVQAARDGERSTREFLARSRAANMHMTGEGFRLALAAAKDKATRRFLRAERARVDRARRGRR